MALGITSSSGGGEAKPYCKYDARAGRMFRVDRSQGSDGMWTSTPTDITAQSAFVADMENISVGWINFGGDFPVRIMSVLGKEPMPARPGGMDTTTGKPSFKQGFSLMILLSKDTDGGVKAPRELSSTAGCVIEAIDLLHDTYLAAPQSKEGKLPVVRIAQTIQVKSGQSTNYKPVFDIVNWVDRPALLVDHAPAANVGAGGVEQRATPPATGNTMRPPPSAPAAQATHDFG